MFSGSIIDTPHLPEPLPPLTDSRDTDLWTGRQTQDSTLFNADVAPISVQGSKDVLSNFYSVDILYKGIYFNSVEHAYQWCKAYQFGRRDLCNRILKAPSATVAKKITRALKPLLSVPESHPRFIDCDLWNSNKETILSELLLIKFDTCPLFRDTLLKSGDCCLAHTVPDLYWGTGSHSLTHNTQFEGRNKFGILLMQLRKTKLTKTQDVPMGGRFNIPSHPIPSLLNLPIRVPSLMSLPIRTPKHTPM